MLKKVLQFQKIGVSIFGCFWLSAVWALAVSAPLPLPTPAPRQETGTAASRHVITPQKDLSPITTGYPTPARQPDPAKMLDPTLDITPWGKLIERNEPTLPKIPSLGIPQLPKTPALSPHGVLLRKNTPLMVILRTAISTEVNHPQDRIEAELSNDVYLYERLLLPRHSRLTGYISVLEKPIEGRNAILGLTFNQITLDNGKTFAIQAHVKTGQDNFMWGGEVTDGTKPRLVTHRIMGIGEYNKVVWAGPRQMGQPIALLPGESFTIILDQPLQLELAPYEQIPDPNWQPEGVFRP